MLAANNAPTITMEIPRPPFMPEKALAISCSIFAAIPDLSNTTPIKTNNGTARRVWLFIIPNILIGKFFKRFKSKTPNNEHTRANIIDTPANVKATG